MEPELRKLEGLETKTASLSQALLTWFRESRSHIEILRARWKHSQLIAASLEDSSGKLRAEIQSQQARIDRLELENQSLRARSVSHSAAPIVTVRATHARIESLQKLVDSYRAENFVLKRRLLDPSSQSHSPVDHHHNPSSSDEDDHLPAVDPHHVDS